MVMINFDDNTAKKLAQLASGMGMSVEAYVESLIPKNGTEPLINWDEVEAELEALSFHGPSLPADFSRADIYFNHD